MHPLLPPSLRTQAPSLASLTESLGSATFMGSAQRLEAAVALYEKNTKTPKTR